MGNALPKINAQDVRRGFASPIPRFLAAFIDYLVISIITRVAGFISVPFDFEYLITFTVTALYFSLGNSLVFKGQTLGKKAFGLRAVVVANSNREVLYLTILQAFARYMLSYGIIILLSSIPPHYFRSKALIAEPYLLELNMLAVMSYTLVNCFSVLLSKSHFGLHDLFCHSGVIREEDSSQLSKSNLSFLEQDGNYQQQYRLGQYILPLAIGVIFSVVLWISGILHSADVRTIHTYRYSLENTLPLRIVSLQHHGDTIKVSALAVSQSATTVSYSIEQLDGLAAQFIATLRQHRLALESTKMTLEIIQNLSSSADLPGEMIYDIDLKTFEKSTRTSK